MKADIIKFPEIRRMRSPVDACRALPGKPPVFSQGGASLCNCRRPGSSTTGQAPLDCSRRHLFTQDRGLSGRAIAETVLAFLACTVAGALFTAGACWFLDGETAKGVASWISAFIAFLPVPPVLRRNGWLPR